MASRKRRRKKKFVKRKVNSGVKALKMVKEMKRAIETKVAETGIASTTITDVGIVTHRIGITQAAGQSSRDGVKILVKSFSFTMICKQDLTVDDANIRIMVLIDRQQVLATVPTLAQILHLVNIYSYRNHVFFSRFGVLYDNIITLNKVRSDTVKIQRTFFFKKGLIQMWSDDLPANIIKNGIYVLLLSDRAANPPTVVRNYRMTFQDA